MEAKRYKSSIRPRRSGKHRVEKNNCIQKYIVQAVSRTCGMFAPRDLVLHIIHSIRIEHRTIDKKKKKNPNLIVRGWSTTACGRRRCTKRIVHASRAYIRVAAGIKNTVYRYASVIIEVPTCITYKRIELRPERTERTAAPHGSSRFTVPTAQQCSSHS